MSDSGTVFIVDDDQAVRDALTILFEAAGYAAEAFPDAETFLATYEPDRPGCLVLDMQMHGMGGLGLQASLAAHGDSRPIIFLTAYGTVPTTTRAFKNGAFDFVEKPAEGGNLLARVREALQKDEAQRRESVERDLAQRCCAMLTSREREILQLVVSGKGNKEIGHLLDISHRTVELHRMHIMQKTGAQNLIELAAIAQAAGLSEPFPKNDTTPKTP